MQTGAKDDIVIHPQKGRREKSIPANGLLLVNPSEAHPIIEERIADGGQARFLFNSKLCVVKDPPCFLAGPAVGSPMAAMTLEKLIVLGAKKIILCGWCGAIDSSLGVGDVVIPFAAVSGEGTSSYYTQSTSIDPCLSLCEQLVALLSGTAFAVSKGAVWSTDAVYRESRNMLRTLLTEKGVVAVDMEFAALCSVASFRGIDFAAVLVVSDEIWGETWRPGFSSSIFKQNKKQILSVLQHNISLL